MSTRALATTLARAAAATPRRSPAPAARRAPLLVTPALAPGALPAVPGRRTVAAKASMEDLVLEKNAANPVVVYSKTYCPYCADVKALFASLGVAPKVVELDALPDVAAAVAAVSGRSTVPQVYVGGVHVGGCDDTVAANASGELARLLDAAGVSVAKA